MSRSIHTTHGDLSREKRCSYSSKELHRQRLRELASAIGKKQRIKLHSRQDRRKRRAADVGPLATDEIPIEVVDEGPWIHYPAAPDDLRAVLARLPAGVLDGLGGIRL